MARVAAAFNDNGSGVRGDMKAVCKAVLLDPEARTSTHRDRAPASCASRCCACRTSCAPSRPRRPAAATRGIDNTDDPATRLNQTVLLAPTVFNFYRPGYVPPNSRSPTPAWWRPSSRSSNEVSVAGYLNYMRGLGHGRQRPRHPAGLHGRAGPRGRPRPSWSTASNLLLMSGTMPETLRTQIITAVTAARSRAGLPDAGRRERAGLVEAADQPGQHRRRQARPRLHRRVADDGLARLPDPEVTTRTITP